MTGNGKHTTCIFGDDWGMVYYCFSHINGGLTINKWWFIGDLLVIYNGFQKTGVLYIYIYIWDQTVTGPEDCRFWSFLVLKHPIFMASLILTHIHTKQLKYHSRLLVGRVYKGLPQLILFLDYSNSWATYHPTSIMGWDGIYFVAHHGMG